MDKQQTSYAEHFISMNFAGRPRFGYVYRMEEPSLPMINSMEFLIEVLDGEPRMPVARVEVEEVIKDYGKVEGFEDRNPQLFPWIVRFYQAGEENTLILFRAAAIAAGELKIEGADEGLSAIMQTACSQEGDPGAWSEEEIAAVLQLSRNEEQRSIKDIEKRRKIAELVAEKINRGD